jgi:1,4-alpha-glucan branching enzyme
MKGALRQHSVRRSRLSAGLIEKDAAAIPDAGWREVFNSDAVVYGGDNVGNLGAAIPSRQHRLNVIIPANGLIVLVKQ